MQWKTRYFRQQGTLLAYFSSKESPEQLGVIPLNRVSELTKRAALTFDLVTPQRVYHLQALDGYQYEAWVSHLEEWMKFLRTVTKQQQEQEYTVEDKFQYEEKHKLLQASVSTYEASNEMAEKQINDLKLQIQQLEETANDRKEQLKLELLKEIEEYDLAIGNMYHELRIKEEQLAVGEKRSDQLLLTISKDASRLVLLEKEYQNMTEQVKRLNEELASHTRNITILEKSIEEELQKQSGAVKKSSSKVNKQLEGLISQLDEKRSTNQHLQNLNSQLTLEMNLAEEQFLVSKGANEETIKFLSEMIEGYENHCQELILSIAETQGASIEMVKELETLKELYFNSLLLRVKLQHQMIGVTLDLDSATLYEKYEFVDFREWSTEIQTVVNQKIASTTKDAGSVNR
eukprot:TRINITY_DN3308_c0_g1_i31.p1 TRINITY_DN3308_c0_g1~~TRINITY_DN3308_c0_g1_i31.p1  ORF type:complete len:403 (-),score=99.19 TRINITY_DN3308_c0_g1_i31:229-1437(-)